MAKKTYRKWRKEALKNSDTALAWLHIEIAGCDPCDGGCNVIYLQKKSVEAVRGVLKAKGDKPLPRLR